MDFSIHKKELRKYAYYTNETDLQTIILQFYRNYKLFYQPILDYMYKLYKDALTEVFRKNKSDLWEIFCLVKHPFFEELIHNDPFIIMEVVRKYLASMISPESKSIYTENLQSHYLKLREIYTGPIEGSALSPSMGIALKPSDSINYQCSIDQVTAMWKTFQDNNPPYRIQTQIGYMRPTPTKMHQHFYRVSWLLQNGQWTRELFTNYFILVKNLDLAMQVSRNLNILIEIDYEFPFYIPQEEFEDEDSMIRYYLFAYDHNSERIVRRNEVFADHRYNVEFPLDDLSYRSLFSNAIPIVEDKPNLNDSVSMHNAMMLNKYVDSIIENTENASIYFLTCNKTIGARPVQVHAIAIGHFLLGKIFITENIHKSFKEFMEHYMSILSSSTLIMIIKDIITYAVNLSSYKNIFKDSELINKALENMRYSQSEKTVISQTLLPDPSSLV